MWAFPKGAEATGDGHLHINNRLPENPLPEVASADKEKFWISQIRYGGLVIWANGVERTKSHHLLASESFIKEHPSAR
jgi:hypothetical protein